VKTANAPVIGRVLEAPRTNNIPRVDFYSELSARINWYAYLVRLESGDSKDIRNVAIIQKQESY
jgi:hypothetical protein